MTYRRSWIPVPVPLSKQSYFPPKSSTWNHLPLICPISNTQTTNPRLILKNLHICTIASDNKSFEGILSSTPSLSNHAFSSVCDSCNRCISVQQYFLWKEWYVVLLCCDSLVSLNMLGSGLPVLGCSHSIQICWRNFDGYLIL